MQNLSLLVRSLAGQGSGKNPTPRKLLVLGGALLAGVWVAMPVFAALREPALLNRDQVRSGLGGRLEQMQNRQELRSRSRDGARRYHMNRNGRPDVRVPRDPIPAPPPASLP